MRSGEARATKLTWARVRSMRAWATSEGARFARPAQVRILQANGYADLSASHINDVLANASWVDLRYRPVAAGKD